MWSRGTPALSSEMEMTWWLKQAEALGALASGPEAVWFNPACLAKEGDAPS